MNRSAQIAFKDITEYLKSNDMFGVSKYGDVWNIHPYHIYSKETRHLNREIGLWGVNKKT